MSKYNPQEIEPRWQQAWEAQGLYDTRMVPTRPKWYALTDAALPQRRSPKSLDARPI